MPFEGFRQFFLLNNEGAETAEWSEDPPDQLKLEKQENLHEAIFLCLLSWMSKKGGVSF